MGNLVKNTPGQQNIDDIFKDCRNFHYRKDIDGITCRFGEPFAGCDTVTFAPPSVKFGEESAFFNIDSDVDLEEVVSYIGMVNGVHFPKELIRAAFLLGGQTIRIS